MIKLTMDEYRYSPPTYLPLLTLLIIYSQHVTTADDVTLDCDVTKGACPNKHDNLDTTTPHSKGKGPGQGDPDKYGFVPAFLIGASIVIIVYIISHCLYLHCYAKKKMRDIARSKHNEREVSSQATATCMLVSDVPSTSLAVRYDGSYGTTEIINTTPYMVCQDNNAPNHELESGESTSSPQCEGSQDGRLYNRYQTGMKSEHSHDSYQDDDVMMTSQHDVPLRFMATTPEGQRDKTWRPVQGYMYQQTQNERTPGTDHQQHTLVFVPVPYKKTDAKYRAMTSHKDDVTGDDSSVAPLSGNASNMVVPRIVENPASERGSQESLTMEHDVIIHDVKVTDIPEHMV